MMRHRIWSQITVAWGWEDGRPSQRQALAKLKAAKASMEKKTEKKKWTVKSFSGSSPTTKKTSKDVKDSVKDSVKSQGTLEALPPGNFPALYLTIADHFQWDA